MATIEFNAYTIHETYRYFSQVVGAEVESYSISLSMGGAAPFPAPKIEAVRLADVKLAFEAYVAEAKASGKPLQIRARIANGRSPAGFKDARLIAEVNPPKPKTAA